jgi:ferredoxin-NADP reductase
VDLRLTAEDGYQAQRSYSISSPPEDGGTVAITIERLDGGEVSPYLTDEVTEGDQIELRGPIGGYFAWTATAATAPLMLVAGGSGVCPLMAMIRHRRAAGSTVPTRLLYSSRTLDEVIFRDELDAAQGEDPSGALEVVHTLTRARPPGWTGLSRRIDRRMLEDVAWPPDRLPATFVCGPTALVESVAASLVELGHPAHTIRTERFGPTGGS